MKWLSIVMVHTNCHSHSILRKDRHVWNAVATDERHESWKRFWLSPLTLPSIQQTEIEKPPVREYTRRQPNVSTSVFVLHKELQLPSESDELKEEMWDRADELLQTPGFIVQAPGYDALMVQHAVGTHSQAPHLIKSTKSGKFVCDCNPY